MGDVFIRKRRFEYNPNSFYTVRLKSRDDGIRRG